MDINYNIVIARYNEDISWLIKYSDKICLYNKGNSFVENYKFKLYRELPNIGREAHTYLKYIIDNYDNLPDYIIFTQGKIEDNFFFKDMNSKMVLNILLHDVIKYGYSKLYKIYESSDLCWGYNFRISNYGSKVQQCKYNFLDWFNKFIYPEFPTNNIFIYPHAIFSVRKDKILSNPKQKYIEIIKELDSIHPETAHYLERSWYYLFNLHLS